jgi:hypothetical protein
LATEARSLLILAIVAGTPSACGGQVMSGTASPDGGLDAELDAGSDHWSPVCPDEAPTAGAPCSLSPGAQCEYGDAWWNPGCDSVFACEQARWAAAPVLAFTCGPPPGPNASTCPTSSLPLGSRTACASLGQACVFSQTICSCDSYEVSQQDAGPAQFWDCFPEPGCPYPRPRLGSACAPEGTNCTYKGCAYGQQCTGGVWQEELAGCAR